MKSVTEILGGAQILLNVSFDIQTVFEEYLTEEHRAFLAALRLIEHRIPELQTTYCGRGRIPIQNQPILRAYLAKSFFKIATNTDLINRLKSDSSLRGICGFDSVPSPATFSRRLSLFSRLHVMEQLLQRIVREHRGGAIVGHISRDSTAIRAREKPANKKKDVADKPKPRRGRPRKGGKRPAKEQKRLARQLKQRPGRAIRELDRSCAWGRKVNSQGTAEYWKGYKLHLDVDDMGIPITAVVTGANVHDSHAAIPMEKKTTGLVHRLYSLMDAAYDAKDIRSYIAATGGVAIIDRNKRRNAHTEPMDPAKKIRFRHRSTVERSNAHLKDWFLPAKIMTKGYEKANFVLMTGVVCLAAVKILQYIVLPGLAPPS
ncbi:MAG: transposase [Pseudomonadales bacterium]